MFIINKQATRVYSKIRHRRGHGIHSPFVFSFVTNIVENRHAFYAYSDIETYLSERRKKKYKSKKINKLIFQIILFYKKNNILEIGSGKDYNALYASAISQQVKMTCVETRTSLRKQLSTLLYDWKHPISLQETLPQTAEKFDCILVDFKRYSDNPEVLCDYLFAHSNENTVIILNNIRTNPSVYSLVQQIRKDQRVRISLDMYQTAVFFFDTKYYKRNYLLSF